MAPDKIEIALEKIRNTVKVYISITLGVLLLIVGGWARAEVRIANNKEDLEYLREHAVNVNAFNSLRDVYRINSESLANLIKDPDLIKVVEDFNRRTKELENKIDLTLTEIVPRGVNEGGLP